MRAGDEVDEPQAYEEFASGVGVTPDGRALVLIRFSGPGVETLLLSMEPRYLPGTIRSLVKTMVDLVDPSPDVIERMIEAMTEGGQS